MKKKILLFVLIAALVFVVPAAAKGNDPVGERINVALGTPTTYPAGEPFHIVHGWLLLPPPDVPLGSFQFRLEIDGVAVKPSFIITEKVWSDPLVLHNRYLYNFPDGMTGIHTFTGYWGGSCSVLVESGTYPGPCATPHEIIEVYVYSLTVTFTP